MGLVMEGSRRTRAIAWLKDRLLPGHDPVAEADAALWEQHKDMVREGCRMDNYFGVPGGGWGGG